jgi:hypothetical protein
VHGVVAGDSGTGGLTLTTPDGRNLSVWYDSTSVQGYDFGLGLDTTPPSNPLGVTGVSGAAASSFGNNESNTINFPSLTAGQGFTLNGLTFTSRGSTTAAELATAFSNLKSGMPALTAAAASTAATLSKGSFSGTFAEGFATSAANNTQVTATAISKGNVGNIISGDTVPTVVKTEGAAGTTTESNVITFKAMNPNEFVTVNGLTFTARVNMTPSEVAAAFSNVASG